MDPDEMNEIQNERDNEQLKREAGRVANKATNGAANGFKKVTSKIGSFVRNIIPSPMKIKIILGICIVVALLVGLAYIARLFGENNLSGITTTKLLKNNLSIEDSGDGEYYFKIDKDFIDKYINGLNAEYENGGYEIDLTIDFDEKEIDKDEDIERKITDDDYSDVQYDEEESDFNKKTIEDWFQTDNRDVWEAYLIKMIRAEIASTYPRIGNYEGEEYSILNNSKNKELGNKIDKNGNYVSQGMAKIQRTDLDGNTIDMRYVPYEQFLNMIKQKDPAVLECFSFEEGSTTIHYATKIDIVTTRNGEEIGGTSYYREGRTSFRVLTAMCSMPFNFLFSLLQTSDNPEYVMAVADLLFEESEVILMLQDQMFITERISTSYPVEKTVSYYAKYKDRKDLISSNESEAKVNYYFPPRGEQGKEELITTTYSNAVNLYIKKAKTWCLDLEQYVTSDKRKTEGEITEEKYTIEDYENKNMRLKNIDYDLISGEKVDTETGNDGTEETALYETYLLTYNYLTENTLLSTYQINTLSYIRETASSMEETINYERFLGLWKNDKGQYYKGALYKKDGIKVGYKLPPDYKEWGYPSETITSSQDEEDIDVLIELLSRHSNTQRHEQIMKYFWNIYKEENVYEVDVQSLIEMFPIKVWIDYGNDTGIIPLSGCNFSREEFIECVTNYSPDFGNKYAGIIYDVCMDKNINPVLCVACAATESGLGRIVPADYDFWGIGVTNSGGTGIGFASVEDAVTYWCDLLITYSTPGTWQNNRIIERATAYSKYSSKFNPATTSVYNLWTLYAWLGTTHEDPNAVSFIEKRLGGCNHESWEETTAEERAEHVLYYVDHKLAKNAQDIFGSKAFGYRGDYIVAAAQEVTQMLLPRGCIYSVAGHDLVWNNINKQLYENIYFCCASYVSSVLYYAEVLPEEEINKYNYHHAGEVGSMLLANGWYIVPPEEAEPRRCSSL